MLKHSRHLTFPALLLSVTAVAVAVAQTPAQKPSSAASSIKMPSIEAPLKAINVAPIAYLDIEGREE